MAGEKRAAQPASGPSHLSAAGIRSRPHGHAYALAGQAMCSAARCPDDARRCVGLPDPGVETLEASPANRPCRWARSSTGNGIAAISVTAMAPVIRTLPNAKTAKTNTDMRTSVRELSAQFILHCNITQIYYTEYFISFTSIDHNSPFDWHAAARYITATGAAPGLPTGVSVQPKAIISSRQVPR